MDSPEKIAYLHLIRNNGSLAEKIVNLQYELWPDVWKPYGEKGRELSIRDAGYHLPFLAESVNSKEPLVFSNYIKWVRKLFNGLNLPAKAIHDTLYCTQEVLKKELPAEAFLSMDGSFQVAFKALEEPLTSLNSYINPDEYLGRLALDFNKALLEGNRHYASEIIMNAVEKGTPVKDIYLQVFQKSQYEVGRLWLENKITVAKEHFCSAATQQIMSMLYPYIFTTQRKNRTFVAASIGGELHEIGIRMVADFFEMEGWDTYYLGANSPLGSLVQSVKDNKAEVIGLSIAMPYHRSLLKETISELRDRLQTDTRIIIGGNALAEVSDPAVTFGADGYAPDALNAVQLAEKLV